LDTIAGGWANTIYLIGEHATFFSSKYCKKLVFCFQFYNNSVLSRQISKDVLRDLVEQLISLLVNGHMEELEKGGSCIRIINTLVLRIVERSDHTNITW
jgi:hypothetical protein